MSKTIQVLTTLKASDWTKLEVLITNKILYKPHKDELILFEILLKQRGNLRQFSRAAANKKLGFNQPSNKQSLDKLLSQLLIKYVEPYLVLKTMKKDKLYIKQQILNVAQQDEKLHFLSKDYTNQVEKEISRLKKDTSYYYHQFVFKSNIYYSPLQPKQVDKAMELIKEAQSNLETYTILENLKLGVELATRKYFFGEKIYDFNFINSIRQPLIKAKKEENLILLYNDMIEAIQSENDSLYFDIKDRVYIKIMEVSKTSQLFMIQFLLNYSKFRFHKGEVLFLKNTFLIYDFSYRNKILIENNQIEGPIFCNAIDVALSLNEIDWVNDFIKNNEELLPFQDESALHLSKASLAFKQKEFTTVLEQLSNCKKEGIFYKVKYRSLLLKTYFELYLMNEMRHDALKALEDSFNKYLVRNVKDTLPEIANKNFISFIKKILDGIINHTLDKNKLILEIEAEKTLSERTWLLQKLEEL